MRNDICLMQNNIKLDSIYILQVELVRLFTLYIGNSKNMYCIYMYILW